MLCPLPSPLLCWQYWWKHLLEQFQVAFLSGPGPLDQAENVYSDWWSVWPRNFLSYSHLLEKAMAPHSSTLAWKIPRTEEPGRLQSVGLLRVRHDWATSPSLLTFMHWRRKWQPTPVFLPGESQGQREPSGLPSVGSHRVGHDWSDLAAAAATFIFIIIFILWIYLSLLMTLLKL